MFFITKCVISEKEFKETDDIVAFPCFPSQPGELEFIYCEGAALRSEFERWHLKDKLTRKVRDFWIQLFREKKGITLIILAENENFLITKGIYDKGIKLYFLNHLFSVDFTMEAWERFKDSVNAEKGDLCTFKAKKGILSMVKKHSFQWNTDTIEGKMILQTRTTLKDTITIPMTEWLNLRELLLTIE